MRLMQQRPGSLINANHIKQSIHHTLAFRAQPLNTHWRRLILLLCVTTLLAAVIHHSEIITSTYLNHDHPREDSGTSTGNKDNYNFLNQELLITNGLHSGGMRLHSTAAATADSDNNSIINKPKHEIRTGGKDGYEDSGKNGRITMINSRKKSIGMSKRSKPDATTANDGDASLESWRGVGCDGKRVFMYNLPPEFNTAILGECDRKMVGWLDFCRHVQHQGFGQQVTDPAWADWYETDPYMLELIFHHKMMAYPCLVPDPAAADAFFLPYYSGLDALRYLYGNNISQSADQGLSLLRWLRQHGHKSKNKSKSKSSIHDSMAPPPDFYWRRKGGHDHFMVMGRTAWDFTAPLNGDGSRGWGTSLASLPQMENVTALFLERRPWRWAEQAVPYPTAFHPRSASSLAAWQRRVLDAHRTFLSAFVGARRSSARPGDLASIRQAALQQCLLLLLSSANSSSSSSSNSSSSCTLVDCSQIKCAHNPIVIAEQLLHADFCLQPPGDTSTRRSTFDGMLSGCIPVFFHTDSAYSQYTWHLPPPPQVSAEGVLHPKAYSIFIGVDDIDRTHEILASIPRTRVIEMRSFIVHHLLPDILYADPTAPDLRDAFQISVESMLSRAAQAPSLSLVS